MRTFVKDCKWGRFLLLRGDMISQYADLYGEWCELEVSLFSRLLRRDSNIVEVGSHIGMHAVPLSKLASQGRVVCFELQRILFQLLCANSALNDRLNIYAYNCAVGSRTCVINVSSSDYETPWNYGSFSAHSGFNTEARFGGVEVSESADIRRLDDIPLVAGLSYVTLLKIDAEGMESEVLKGADALIRKHRPTLFVENNNANRGDTLIELIREMGYQCYWYCTNRFQPNNYNRVSWQIAGCDINMVCFPSEGDGKALGLTEVRQFSDLTEGKVPIVAKWN